jgi:hypothetical protein
MAMTSAEVLALAMVVVRHGQRRGWNRCSGVLPCSEEGEGLAPFLDVQIDPSRATKSCDSNRVRRNRWDILSE